MGERPWLRQWRVNESESEVKVVGAAAVEQDAR